MRYPSHHELAAIRREAAALRATEISRLYHQFHNWLRRFVTSGATQRSA